MLSRLVYYSTISQIITMTAIRQIIAKSIGNNEAKEITGALYFNEHYFIQVLEGDRTQITLLFNKICLDERHQNVTLIDFSSISHRSFVDWAMLYLKKDTVAETEILKEANITAFDLDRITSENILEFLINQTSKSKV